MSESATVTGSPLTISARESERAQKRRGCPDVTAEIDAALRDHIDEIVVAAGALSNSQAMHIPRGDGSDTLCGRHTKMTSAIRKPHAVYPPGYREFCKYCAARYRIENGGVEDAE